MENICNVNSRSHHWSSKVPKYDGNAPTGAQKCPCRGAITVPGRAVNWSSSAGPSYNFRARRFAWRVRTSHHVIRCRQRPRKGEISRPIDHDHSAGVACLRFITARLKKPVRFTAVTRPSCITAGTFVTAKEITQSWVLIDRLTQFCNLQEIL